MDRLRQDLEYALRVLAKSPGFTAVAILSLGLGIGANTAIFSLVNALLLRPLPVARPHEMVAVYTSDHSGDRHGTSSYLDYLDFRAGNDALSGLVAYSPTPVNLGQGTESRVAFAETVSGNYFAVLGLAPRQGRVITDQDDRPGSEPVTVISERAWRRDFGADPRAIGSRMSLNGVPFTVIGVAPAEYSGLLRGLAADLWVPLATLPHLRPGTDDLTERGARGLFLMGRLAPGATRELAAGKFEPVREHLFRTENRAWRNLQQKSRTIEVLPEWQTRVVPQASGAVVGFLSLLATVVGLVLLIACVNLASLLLARAAFRRREIGVRLALGAARARIVRQLLTESLLLALAGGALGVVVAAWGMELLMALRPPVPVPILLDLHVDSRVLAFTVLLATLTGLAFGLGPALAASRPDLLPALRDQDAGHIRTSRVRGVLVAGQVAVSVILLVGCGLFVRSLKNAHAIDPGFVPGRLALVSVDASLAGYDEARGQELFREVRERLATLPGVQEVAVVKDLPLGLNHGRRRTWIEGYEERPGEDMEISFTHVGPRYFETLQVPVVRGRALNEEDRAGAAPAVMVNEAFAARYWPGQEPLEKRVSVGGRSDRHLREVVGVTRTGKYQTLGEQPRPFLYLPLAQNYESSATVVVRTAGDPAALLGTIKSEILRLSPNLPIFETKTMDAHLGLALLPARVAGSVLGTFGAVALILAALGLYGVMSYAVSQRTREMGIRLAIGAARGDLLRLVVGHGMKLAGAGLAVGLVLAFAAARLVASLLYGLSPTDPATFTGAAAVLLAVAFTACYLPARRAARVDPMIALRNE